MDDKYRQKDFDYLKENLPYVRSKMNFGDYLFANHLESRPFMMDQIDKIVENENGRLTVMYDHNTHTKEIDEIKQFGDYLALVDKDRGVVWSELEGNDYAIYLTERCAEAIALRAFEKNKPVVAHFKHFNIGDTMEDVHRIIKERSITDTQEAGSLVYAQNINNVQDVSFLWDYNHRHAIIETDTNIFVPYDSPVIEKYKKLAYHTQAATNKRTKLEAMRDKCGRDMFGGRLKTFEAENKKFNKEMSKLRKQDLPELKRYLAASCFYRGIEPIFITGFDVEKSDFTQDKYNKPISIANPKMQDMVSKQDLFLIGSNDLDFQFTELVAVDGDCLIAAICRPIEYEDEYQLRMYSSIDFSEELREFQQQHLPRALNNWERQHRGVEDLIALLNQEKQIDIESKEQILPGNRD